MEPEDAAVTRDEPVAAGRLVGGHRDDRFVEAVAARRALERRAAEVEDPAIGRERSVRARVTGGGGGFAGTVVVVVVVAVDAVVVVAPG